MYLTRHPTSNVKMNAQIVFACLMLFVGLAGFVTTLTLGLIYNVGVVMIGLLVFFFVVAIVALVTVVNKYDDSENENIGLSCWQGV
jgi:fatty acid desaturase